MAAVFAPQRSGGAALFISQRSSEAVTPLNEDPRTMNEILLVVFGGVGSYNDRERAWLLSNVGASGLSNNDLWYVYLRSQGYTGSVQEMKRAFFETII